ncbi:MAG TPA: FAD-binding protein, partial [Stellaceae bacterium]|nr:FAD-binding protein [Stellaceae bacterium]
RLSGNAIPEALVFGECAGRHAALHAMSRPHGWRRSSGTAAVEQIRRLAEGRHGDVGAAALLDELRELMEREVGPFRTAAGLGRAVARLGAMRAALPGLAIAPGRAFNPTVADWFELRGSLVAAQAVAHAALARHESRGAHQREDFPETDAACASPQHVRMASDGSVAAGFAQ